MSSSREKRRLKRYRHKSEFSLSFKNTSFKGKITDYTLKGIGFLIDGNPSLPPGSDVHFRAGDLELDDDGKIVWSRDVDSCVKGGIERKSISGLLKHYPLADILIDLKRSEKHGILEIGDGPVMKRIYFKNGDIVFATSNKEEDHFVKVILRAGKITTEQYHQIADISKKKGKSQGAILVELGYLKPEDLIWAVKYHVEEIILSLFEREDGKFAFTEGTLFSKKITLLKLSTVNLIYRGIKRIDSFSSIQNAMPPEKAILGCATDPLNLFQDMNLEKKDKVILSLVNGKRSIKEIMSLSPADQFQTLKTLYAFLSTKMIDLTEETTHKDRIHEEVLDEPLGGIDEDFLEKVETFYHRIESADYYSILGVEKWASLDKIRKAYYSAAKEFHSDRHIHLPSDSLKGKLNSIFTHLTNVYKVLSDEKKRMQYDQELSAKPARLQSDNAQANKVELAKIRFKEGQEAFRQGAYALAKELFGQAVYLDSAVAVYYYYLGLVHERENNFHEAGKVLGHALKLDPLNADYLAALGSVYLHLGFNLRAKTTFEKAIKIDPSNKQATEGLGKAKGLLNE